MKSKREEGSLGEDSAASYLKKHGYKILERNYRSPFGEVDIVAREKDVIVFVEVKKRNSDAYGHPLEAVTPGKQRHIIRSALFYLKTHRDSPQRIRFDVLGIAGETIKLVRNAFEAE